MDCRSLQERPRFLCLELLIPTTGWGDRCLLPIPISTAASVNSGFTVACFQTRILQRTTPPGPIRSEWIMFSTIFHPAIHSQLLGEHLPQTWFLNPAPCLVLEPSGIKSRIQPFFKTGDMVSLCPFQVTLHFSDC